MTPEEFIERYKTALATQQWQQVAPLICSDACVTFSTGAVHKGIAAIEQAYRHNFSVIKNEEYKVSDVEWLHKEVDIAVYVFLFEWKGLIGGKPASGAGRGTCVIRKEADGWKLLAEHLGPAQN
ncbi:MAG: nuclear transport factor 2 family protein [Chitinophagales bacterium]